MRALAPLFAVLASVATITSAMVRLWWSKPKQLTIRGQPAYTEDGEPLEIKPKAPTWLQTTAKWWLRFVVFGLTLAAIIVIVVIVIRIINISQ